MESYCNMNASDRRNYYNPSTRSNHSQMNSMRNNAIRNRESQTGICNRTTHNQMEDYNQAVQRRERDVQVECSCQVKCDKDCHRHDDMARLGCEFPVVMSYVPWQQWGDMYEAECGLMQGTIFKDLNYIFCGERC